MNNNTPSPMTISIKHWGKTLTAELPWDSPLEDIYQAVQGLLVADGFHNVSIEFFIKEHAEELTDLEKYKNSDDES
jgi:hypothetical protein